MKKLFVILILLVGFATTSVVGEEVFTEPELGFELVYANFAVGDLQGISALIMANMPVKEGEEFNSPETILSSGMGTKNDFAIMFINIAKVMFDVELDLAIIDTRDYLGEVGSKYHAMIMYNGIIYNVYDIRFYFPVEPSHVYKFHEVFLQNMAGVI